MKHTIFILVSCVIVMIEASVSIQEARLSRKLFTHHGFQSKPNGTDVVYYAMFVRNLFVDEENGIVTLQGHASFSWNVPSLTWDPDEYGGLKSAKVHEYYIWTPDILPFNGYAGDTAEKNIRHSGFNSVSVFATGKMYMYFDAEIPFYCSLDHTNYPFDEQKCKLIMGSWLYEASELDLQPYGATSTFSPYNDTNPNWSLKKYTKERNYMKESDYLDITLTLWLKRRFSLYVATLIVPLVFSAILTAVMFLIPSWNPKKMSTGLIAVVILVSLLVHLSWKLPPTIKEPKIVRMCKNTLYAVCASLVSSVIVMNLDGKSLCCPAEPPNFVLYLLKGIVGRMLCICNADTDAITHGAYKRNALDGSEDKVYVGDVSRQDGVHSWQLVSLAIDRALLVVYAITLIVTATQ